MSQASHDPTGGTTAVSPYVMGFRDALFSGRLKPHGSLTLSDLEIEVAAGGDAAWAIVRRPGKGGLAIRLAYAPGSHVTCSRLKKVRGGRYNLEISSALGRHQVALKADGHDLHRLRITVQLTSAVPLLIPFLPRDLLPLGINDDPLRVKGQVEAAQRGLNSGLLYFHLDEPDFGSVLYFQNLTTLNPYFIATHTKPDGAVGGVWPELGYLPPSPSQSGTPPTHALPEGQPITISDAILIFRDEGAADEQQSARHFIQMLGSAYTALELPQHHYHDWVWRAERTLSDLERSPKATVTYRGHTYAHPYTGSEYPDSMVQLSLLACLRDYTDWRGKGTRLEHDFAKGLERFFDKKLGTLRRYLPNVGGDKDANAVDS